MSCIITGKYRCTIECGLEIVRKLGRAEEKKCRSSEERKCGSTEEQKSGSAEEQKHGRSEVRKECRLMERCIGFQLCRWNSGG
jgi:hypothetical protein